uniref:tRNA-intron lyase n=1 Tax=Oryza punctata TaxID=4537 RepID=A0A0E0LC87_ORYPU
MGVDTIMIQAEMADDALLEVAPAAGDTTTVFDSLVSPDEWSEYMAPMSASRWWRPSSCVTRRNAARWWSAFCHWVEHMDLPGPRWKKGKDGKDFGSLAAANPMSAIVSELKASFISSKPVAILSGPCGSAVLGVQPEQAGILNRAAFGHGIENATAQKHWFQLSPEEVFYLCHALNCIRVDSQDNKQMTQVELWDYFTSGWELFPEMYKAYSHLRLKNWVVRSGLQYGADFVAYRHHPALVHSEFAVVVVPEGAEFGNRCGRLEVWSDLLCALRASGSVAKTLLVLTISSSSKCELSSPDCLQQLVVHERKITRWIPQQCREQRCEPRRDEVNREDLIIKKESVVFNHWGVILGFTVLSSLLVYRLKFRQWS